MTNMCKTICSLFFKGGHKNKLELVGSVFQKKPKKHQHMSPSFKLYWNGVIQEGKYAEGFQNLWNVHLKQDNYTGKLRN